jgi:hypothetical protein
MTDIDSLVAHEDPRSVIFINGKGGVGKTELGMALERRGFRRIELDEVIRGLIVPGHPCGDDVFQLYRPGKYQAEKQQLVAAVGPISDRTVIVGSIRDPELFTALSAGRPSLLIYVQPADEESYRNAIRLRARRDAGRTLGFLADAIAQHAPLSRVAAQQYALIPKNRALVLSLPASRTRTYFSVVPAPAL